MPELGEVRRFGDGVRVYLSAVTRDPRTGYPLVIAPQWVRLRPQSPEGEECIAALDGLPDGAVVDMAMLAQGKVAVVSRPEQGAKLDDLTMLALEKEAEVARLEDR